MLKKDEEEKKEEEQEEVKEEPEEEMPEKKLSMAEFTEILGKNIGKQIDDKLKEYDKVEKKHAIFPSKDDPEGNEYKSLPKEQRWAKFFKALIMRDKVHLKALTEGTAANGG